jgi:hypothetical protein
MSPSAVKMTPEQRNVLATLAEEIIPAAHGMPSAGETDLAHRGVDIVLKFRPDLLSPLAQALEIASEYDGPATAENLEQAHPEAFERLLQVLFGAYYLHSEVRRRIGYDGQQALLLPRGGFGAEELVADLMGQSPRYRQIDEAREAGG